MDINQFKQILISFADDPSDVDLRLGKATVQIRDEVLDVGIAYSADDAKQLQIVENGQTYNARTWLLNRVARLPQLADRIIASSTAAGLGAATPFVTPSGVLTPDLGADIKSSTVPVGDAVASLLTIAGDQLPGATSVLYLTSDAGEGKTTVLNRVALKQAQRFKQKLTSTLVVPIPLSGRAFLTFDDAVIAALVNRLRFNYFYFDAFLALVKLGAIVPAFDGYEEMLVEGSKGEAVSALGGLVQSLDSSGTIFVAARKAFFDYLSFKSQARLFDAIGNHSASFSRLELSRWSRAQFCDYGKQRHVVDPDGIYETVAARLGGEHPLLTRAVLVKRLFDVAGSEMDREHLAALLGSNPQDYFYTFVDAIVKREASEKWLARVSGDLMEPLLQLGEHHDLLAQIAVEMWQSSANSLKHDVIDVIVEMFAEGKQKSPMAVRQIKERIKQHSLLAADPAKGLAVAFDHEDFQDFYLGEGLGRVLASRSRSDVFSVFAVNALSAATIEQAVQYLMRASAELSNVVEVLKQVNSAEVGFSFVKENCGALIMRLAEFLSGQNGSQEYSAMYFPADGLSGRNLRSIIFENCHFQPTSTGNGTFHEVEFRNCEFERLDVQVNGAALVGCAFDNCRIDSLLTLPDEEQFYEPSRIDFAIKEAGGHTEVPEGGPAFSSANDDRTKLLSRFLRIFLRTTQVNEEVLRLKFGNALTPRFMEEVLPALLASNVVAEVPWEGRGVQRRYRLAAPMSVVSDALESSQGDFDKFLSVVRS